MGRNVVEGACNQTRSFESSEKILDELVDIRSAGLIEEKQTVPT